MFRILTFSQHRLAEQGQPVGTDLARRLQFEGFDHNDPLECQMAQYVTYQMREDRWRELRPHIEACDGGNSHSPRLEVYLRMLAEHRRIMDSRKPGFDRFDYLLDRSELEQVAEARTLPSQRRAAK